jgi:hypothetical protein
MLGVLPSYTALGMAALLPHHTLAYKQNANLDVLADGTGGIDAGAAQRPPCPFRAWPSRPMTCCRWARTRAGSWCATSADLRLSRQDRHDGRQAGSETKTFEAAAQTLQELNRSCWASSSIASTARLVLVTADHGFLYQESPLDEADKSTLATSPGTLKAKKRYLLGRNRANPKAWCGNTAVTAGTTPGGSLDFWVPKGRQPLPLCRWRTFCPWQRHAAGDRGPGDYRARERGRPVAKTRRSNSACWARRTRW